ncbi:hypothetical protein [Cupriavidus basilensis]|uniref:hypothetical protein n=1 Tax=Cupriavidus basilensis TaxID=68895 RepID=UPI0023E8A49E|nr:hypothetical protein [Cupriavidus basilensis]MDF3888858.1 hypothetical protein [Cupriavidus basilensis]
MPQLNLDLDIPTSSVPLKRELAGFLQFRESEHDPWRFYVAGFDATASGERGYCWVLTASGDTEPVPIDEQDRILIDGKRYGREAWNH